MEFEALLCLQSEVDTAAEFAVVLDHFEKWMEARGLGSHHSVAIGTDGSVPSERRGGGCQCVSVSLCMCVSVCVHVCVHVCVFMCVWALCMQCVCMSVCVFVCV